MADTNMVLPKFDTPQLQLDDINADEEPREEPREVPIEEALF